MAENPAHPDQSDFQFRQALTLTAYDALSHTDPLTAQPKAAILALLRRLVSAEPLDATQEGDWISTLLAHGCNLNPPFESTIVGRAALDDNRLSTEEDH